MIHHKQLHVSLSSAPTHSHIRALYILQFLNQFYVYHVTNSTIYFQTPLSLVNPADCVDMDCDGMKKALIRDLDGTFLGGTGGTVVPDSQFEWDGDPRRGLGDYRIPTAMLTNPDDGSRILAEDKCPNKGKRESAHAVDCVFKLLRYVVMV